METITKSKRGFASMSPERMRQVCSLGGKAAHALGKAHKFTPEEASAAAKAGHSRGTAHEFNREEARIAGRKGGLVRAANRKNLSINTPATV